MSMVLSLLQQVITMFLLVGVGYVMFRCGKISMEGSKTLGNILIYLSLPCVILNGFLLERTPEHLWGLLYSTIGAVIILLLCIIISRLMFKKDDMAAFAATFSNPGFFGVPLITATFGSSAVFYMAPFIAGINLLQWTYGVHLLTHNDPGEKKNSGALAFIKKVLTAPFMVGILIGLFFFLTAIPVPSILQKSISFLAGVNTPLAMFTVGVYLAQTDILKMFRNTVLYRICAVRLLLIPVFALVVLTVLPINDQTLKLSLLIAAACPVGSNIAVYAQLHNKDYSYAVQTVILSTLICVITIPVLAGIAQMIW